MLQTSLMELKTLIFKVGQEEYGADISQVVSIERMEPITAIPNCPPHVLGVTTIRDIIMPVVDLRAALTGEKLKQTAVTRIIVVQVHNQEIALVVDSATDVSDIPSDTIQHPNMLESKKVNYLMGVSRLEKRLIILLDIEKLLEDTTNLDELREMKSTF